MHAPRPDNEAGRLAALRRIRVLDTAPEAAFDSITRLAASLCDAPIALISLIDDERQWFKSVHGPVGVTQTPRAIAFCAHAILSAGLTEVRDAQRDQRFQDNPQVRGAPGIRFYAAMPLTDASGFALGTLCVIDHRPRGLNEGQKAALADLARMAAALLEIRRVEAAASRLSGVFDRAAIAVFTLDPDDLRIVDANGCAARMCGVAPDELPGRRFDTLLGGAPAEAVAAIRRGEGEQAALAATLRRADGTLLPVDLRIHLTRDGAGPAAVAVVQDASALRQVERKLAHEAEQARKANAAKSDFLANMSHELRTPLNAVIGFSQMLLLDSTRNLTAAQKEYCQFIESGGQHLLGVINQVLDLSAIEANRMKLTLEAVDVGGVLERTRDLMEPIARKAGVTIDVAGWDVPPVCADDLRLSQVLMNLASNAIKYNRRNGSVRLTAAAADGGRVRIAVADTGRGIAPEHHARLFKPFERLGAERSAIEGAGIGLALVAKITAAMGGTVGFTSEVGVGTTFWIDLPPADAVAGGSAAGPGAAPPPRAAAGRCTVLYVEDDPANLHLMERLIATLKGVTMLSAPTPGIGLELAMVHRPDLIILDINLPEMDGYAVLARLRATPETRDVPVLALSAWAMPRDIERGLAAGFAGYMTKPIQVPKLLETISAAVAGRAAA